MAYLRWSPEARRWETGAGTCVNPDVKNPWVVAGGEFDSRTLKVGHVAPAGSAGSELLAAFAAAANAEIAALERDLLRA